MTQVVFSFDTEDYVSPVSDNAILRLSAILKAEGVKGCFNVVAELAQTLVDRKRFDVIESLEGHEVDYHSYRHSWHPTIVEYSDTEIWEEGYQKFLEEESKGIQIVKNVFKRDKLWASIPPGNCISSQAIYGYVELGVNVYSGSVFKGTSGKGIWFCNALNLENNCYIDNILHGKGLAEVGENLENWSRWDRLVICCHPNLIYHNEFWDALNFNGSNMTKWGEWTIPAQRPEHEIEKYYDDFRETIRILKDDSRFEFVTYEDIWKEQQKKGPRVIPFETLKRFLNLIKMNFFYIVHDNDSYSLADIFHATVHFLCGNQNDFPVVESVGPMYEPAGVTGTLSVSSKMINQAARQLLNHKEIPHEIYLGHVPIGPRDFMEAAIQVFEGKSEVMIYPKPQLPDISTYYRLNDFNLRNTWMYSKSFIDTWVSDRIKWQSWTIRSE